MAEEEVADFQEDEYQEYEETGEGENFEVEDVEANIKAMEDELNEINQNQAGVTEQLSAADRVEENSVYVGQVDYESTVEELRSHFAPCGTINRVTIICDKITGQSKGFAYIEFVDKESAEKALELDESTFRGRQLKVLPKRQNVPIQVMRGGRGRGGRGGGRFGAVYGRGAYRGGGRGYYGGRAPYGGRGRGPPGGGRFARGSARGGGRGGYGAYQNPYY